MKRTICLIAGLLFFFSIVSWAATPTPVSAPQTKSASTQSPNAHQINKRIRDQWQLTLAGFKSKKITAQQRESIRKSLKNVKQQLLAFYKQNNSHEITSAQQGQLNQSLNANSSLLGETPVN
jgi:biopolymer transport protein ExbD